MAKEELVAPEGAIGAVQLYGTLYLDMLGWGSELLGLDSVALKATAARDRQEVLGRVLPTIKKYELVREVMDRALQRAFEGSPTNPALAQRVGPEGAELLQLTRAPHSIYSGFSDCFVLSIPLAKHPRFGPIPILMHLYGLMTCGSIALVTLLGEGIPVRGAIEVGVGAEIQRNPSDPVTFVGASLAKSYLLERKAGHLRIQLGDDLLEFCNWAANQPAPRLDAVRPGAVEMLKSAVMQEADGSHSVDYLKVHRDPDLSSPSLKKARSFVEEQIAKAVSTGDEKRRTRYVLVRDYFDRPR